MGVSRLENIIESYIFNHRTLLSRIDCATCLHYNYYRRAILSSLDAHNSNPRGISFELFRALENLLSVGESFVVRIMRLRVKKSVAQRVVSGGSARHIPGRGRLARHRKRFWPKTAPRIPTSSAPVIGPDRENKDSHGHNRGSTSGYGPVLYRYEHSATPAPPIYSPSFRTSLYSTSFTLRP